MIRRKAECRQERRLSFIAGAVPSSLGEGITSRGSTSALILIPEYAVPARDVPEARAPA